MNTALNLILKKQKLLTLLTATNMSLSNLSLAILEVNQTLTGMIKIKTNFHSVQAFSQIK